MERARKVANRATLKRLVNESNLSKQSRNSEISTTSPVSYTPSRYVSSLSLFGSKSYSISDLLGGKNVSNNVGFSTGSQIRSISVEALKSSDTFPRRHNSATPEEQTKMSESCGFNSLDALIDATVPKANRLYVLIP